MNLQVIIPYPLTFSFLNDFFIGLFNQLPFSYLEAVSDDFSLLHSLQPVFACIWHYSSGLHVSWYLA